jgi:hypothetical protein
MQGILLMSQTVKRDNVTDRLVHSLIASEIDFCLWFVAAAERAYQEHEIDRGNEATARAKEIYERTVKLVEQEKSDAGQNRYADLDRIRKTLEWLSVRS